MQALYSGVPIVNIPQPAVTSSLLVDLSTRFGYGLFADGYGSSNCSASQARRPMRRTWLSSIGDGPNVACSRKRSRSPDHLYPTNEGSLSTGSLAACVRMYFESGAIGKVSSRWIGSYRP